MSKLWTFFLGLLIISSLFWVFYMDLSHYSYSYMSWAGGQHRANELMIGEVVKCFVDGQIPCRWIESYSYGSPLFNYLAPLPYYIGALIALVTGNLFISAAAIFTLAVLGAYALMFLLLLKFFSKWLSLLLALSYSFISYIAVYNFGSVGSLWLIMLFPAFVWLILRLRQSEKVINSTTLGIILSLVILSQNLGLLLFLSLLILLSGLFFYQTRSLRFVKLIFLSTILGLLLSSFYFIPMVFEKDYIHSLSGVNYLPIFTHEVHFFKAESPYQVLTGETKVSSFKKGTNWISFQTDTKTHSIIRLSQYYFPNWQLTVDGKVGKIYYENNNLGLITMILGPGNHIVSLKLIDTPIRVVSNLLSLLGVVLLLGLILTQLKGSRKWIFYYLKSLNR